MADKMSKGFLGMTAHWIDIEEEQLKSGQTVQHWMLRGVVIGFRCIAGGHNGENMGRYFMGITDRVGITGRTFLKVSLMHGPLIDELTDWQLYCATLNNASSNGMLCQSVQKIHVVCCLWPWSAVENKIP